MEYKTVSICGFIWGGLLLIFGIAAAGFGIVFNGVWLILSAVVTLIGAYLGMREQKSGKILMIIGGVLSLPVGLILTFMAVSIKK